MSRTHSHPEATWLTTAEVAKQLGVSTRTVVRYEEAGHLLAKRLPSGHRRYAADSVEQLLDAGAARSKS